MLICKNVQLMLRDVSKRVMAHLTWCKNCQAQRSIDHEVIVVAQDLTPTDTAQLEQEIR